MDGCSIADRPRKRQAQNQQATHGKPSPPLPHTRTTPPHPTPPPCSRRASRPECLHLCARRRATQTCALRHVDWTVADHHGGIRHTYDTRTASLGPWGSFPGLRDSQTRVSLCSTQSRKLLDESEWHSMISCPACPVGTLVRNWFSVHSQWLKVHPKISRMGKSFLKIQQNV